MVPTVPGSSEAKGTEAPVAAPASAPESSVPIGAIVGGVLGGLALLALLVFAGFKYTHKKTAAVVEPVVPAAPAAMAEVTKPVANKRVTRLSVDTVATAHSESNADVMVATPTAAMSRQA